MTYVPSGNPTTGSDGLSALMRAEFASIGTAFSGTASTADVTVAVAAEASARTAAVSAEATTRAAADTAEATTRAAADTAEATTRAAADALLAPIANPAFTGTAGFVFSKTTPSAPVTAHAGGGQTNATLLTAGVNRVTVVASNNDSVKLPASVVGLVVEVSNEAVNNATLFGFSGGDTVKGGSSTQLLGGTLGYYRCVAAGVWVGGTLT